MKFFPNLERKHYFLLAGWLLINIVQSVFTNLHADEAYYWMYSKQLAWGYFDHPPMVAFLIFLSNPILHNELVVRLFFILLSTITMAMIMNELDEKKDLLFLSLFIMSFPLVHTHIGGFLALPDIPLVFFSLLFYLGYKNFINAPNIKMALVMALVAAAMIYSKYHAFLVLGFIVLSNLKLLRNKYFWITVGATVLFLIPHILWQFENNFPTFVYHLTAHSRPVNFWTVQNNITSQLIVAGPLTFFIVFLSLSKFKVNDDLYKRAIIVSILGFYIFFFVLSFTNRIEGHYTTAITPLLMIATYPIISNNPRLKKWFTRLSFPVIIIFFLFRFYMAADFLPNIGKAKISFYNHKATTSQIKQMANGKKVASFNNFDFPGTYEFYTGDPAIHLATPGYRFCQYDLWNKETIGEGDPLFIIIPYGLDTLNFIKLENGKKFVTEVTPKFQSLKNLNLSYTNTSVINEILTIDITLSNKFKHAIEFNHPSSPAIGFKQSKNKIPSTQIFKLTGKERLEPNEEFSFKYNIPINSIDKNAPLVVFTQTIERNRGQLLVIDKTDYKF